MNPILVGRFLSVPNRRNFRAVRNFELGGVSAVTGSRIIKLTNLLATRQAISFIDSTESFGALVIRSEAVRGDGGNRRTRDAVAA